MARITAIGGMFFYSPDPKALIAWYRETLGLTVEDWGGAMIGADGAGPGYSLWTPFTRDAAGFKPSTREFSINFSVDDLDTFVAQIEAKGVAIIERQEMEGMGKFAWILDPDGTKIEFWEPPKE